MSKKILEYINVPTDDYNQFIKFGYKLLYLSDYTWGLYNTINLRLKLYCEGDLRTVEYYNKEEFKKELVRLQEFETEYNESELFKIKVI